MEQEKHATGIPVHLLTGEPRVGKSTLIKRIVGQVGSEHCGGFYTEEVLEDSKRTGFRLVTLDGKTGVLAHECISGPVRHGRYGVDLACLEQIGVPAITEAVAQKWLVIIDELGPIEVYSEAFRHAVLAALDSPVPVMGTIALTPHPWLDRIKQHTRVKTSVLTVENREAMSQDFLRFAKASIVVRLL